MFYRIDPAFGMWMERVEQARRAYLVCCEKKIEIWHLKELFICIGHRGVSIALHLPPMLASTSNMFEVVEALHNKRDILSPNSMQRVKGNGIRRSSSSRCSPVIIIVSS